MGATVRLEEEMRKTYEFFDALREYDNFAFEETFEGDFCRVKVKCGKNLVLDHSFIKCDCESEETAREYSYGIIADRLFEMGIGKIRELCDDKEKSR